MLDSNRLAAAVIAGLKSSGHVKEDGEQEALQIWETIAAAIVDEIKQASISVTGTAATNTIPIDATGDLLPNGTVLADASVTGTGSIS